MESGTRSCGCVWLGTPPGVFFVFVMFVVLWGETCIGKYICLKKKIQVYLTCED